MDTCKKNDFLLEKNNYSIILDFLQIYINIYSLLRINYISSQLMIFMPPTYDKQDKDIDLQDEEIEEGKRRDSYNICLTQRKPFTKAEKEGKG